MTDGAAAPSVDLYWRPGCGFCSVLRHRLRRAGVVLEEHDIWADPSAAAFVRSVADGNETVPTVVVGGTALVNPPAREVLARLGLGPRPGIVHSLVQRARGRHARPSS